MQKKELLDIPIGTACGAPRHDFYFKNDENAKKSIFEMVSYGKKHGIKALLEREYPNPEQKNKNIIVNFINGNPYIIDGNRHLVALLMIKSDLTFQDLNELHPHVLRVWFEGVEFGVNNSPYEVYIPRSVDVSKIPEAREGIDGFKTPNEAIYIVPANFASNDQRLNERDRGYLIYQTVINLLIA